MAYVGMIEIRETLAQHADLELIQRHSTTARTSQLHRANLFFFALSRLDFGDRDLIFLTWRNRDGELKRLISHAELCNRGFGGLAIYDGVNDLTHLFRQS